MGVACGRNSLWYVVFKYSSVGVGSAIPACVLLALPLSPMARR